MFAIRMSLEKEFKYYLDHQSDIVKKYNGRIVVIKNENVIGDYGDESEALVETTKTEDIGTFLIQRVSPGDEDYTQTFHTRVSFK